MCTFWGLVLLVCGGCALTWVRPGDDSWSVARLDWTSLPEGPQPTEVAFAETPDDVQQVLRNTTWTKVCVRSGRHSYTLFSLCNGTVIDLSRLNDVSLLTGGLVRVGGGVRNWNAALLLAQRNVTWVGGTGPSVGAGYALGGGYSLVSRAYGMACDNIVEAEIVLGSGAVVVANATNTYADLFWALRGAGNGNFGAVTHVTYKLPTAIPEVTTMWDLAWSNATDALAVVTGWEDFLLSVFSDKRITPLVLVSADGTVRSSGLFLGRQVQLMPILDKWLDAVPAASSSRIWEASWLDSLVSFGGCGSIEVRNKSLLENFRSACFFRGARQRQTVLQCPAANHFGLRSLPTFTSHLARRVGRDCWSWWFKIPAVMATRAS